MLTPETLKALDDALDAVIQEAGHDPQYAELVHALQAAQHALPGGDDAAQDAAEPQRDDEGDKHSFMQAAKQMAARRAGAGK